MFFLGDSITYNLFTFTVCEIRRAGFTVHSVSSDSKDSTARKVEALHPASRTSVQAFWERWFSAPWPASGHPALGMNIDVQYVVETNTILVREMTVHFQESEFDAIETLSDVLVANYGLHYDLVSEQQRRLYAGDLLALATRMAAFAKRPGKYAFYRETSRTHVRSSASTSCSCTAPADEPQRPVGRMEWSEELNDIARREISRATTNVHILPFYDITAAMPHGHPENFTAYWNHFAQPDLCDCSHWCYSPQLVRSMFGALLKTIS